MLKAETGDFANTNTTRDALLNALLSNKQKQLATENQWPFLERRWNVPVAANTQYVSLPTTTSADPTAQTVDIDLDRLPFAEVLFNQVYLPIRYGIGDEEYNALNFAFGRQSDPIQRWRLATNAMSTSEASVPVNAFEVWPVPVTAQTIRFTGRRALLPLTDEAHKCDLDDMLIVLFVAADLLARAKQPDAPLKLQNAQKRFQWLIQGWTQKDVRRTLDNDGDARFHRDMRLRGMTVIVH